MIANKVLPSFYVLDMEGEAANLEFLLGKDFGIKRMRIGSADFPTDLDATAAALNAIDFFATENPNLDLGSMKEEQSFNPEFYPSLGPIKLTPEQQAHLDETLDKANAEAGEDKIATVLTRHFDEIGDFVTSRLDVEGSNFSMTMKIAVNPQTYMEEKGKALEYDLTHALGPHREHNLHRAIIH